MSQESAGNTEPWYAARLLFGQYDTGSALRATYEERIVLVRASSPEEAISLAESEAKEYTQSLSADVRYEGFCNIFHLFDSEVGDRTEVYSNIHISRLSPSEFFDRFIDFNAGHDENERARAVAVTEDELVVDFVDGRRMSVPLAWYPRLLSATAAERQNCSLLGDGYAIEWPDLDEHVGIDGLLAGRASGESQESLEHWLAVRRDRLQSGNK